MKACDGAVLYGDTVLLLECKATLLPYGVRAEGDLDMLRQKVANIFGKAAEQFDDTILAIEDGCLREWVPPGTVTCYLPLVVTLDMIPVEPFFYQTIEGVIAKRNALSHAKARPLQVLAVSELEQLEEYMAEGGSLADLLQERIENGTYRDSSMKKLSPGEGNAARPAPQPSVTRKVQGTRRAHDGVDEGASRRALVASATGNGLLPRTA